MSHDADEAAARLEVRDTKMVQRIQQVGHELNENLSRKFMRQYTIAKTIANVHQKIAADKTTKGSAGVILTRRKHLFIQYLRQNAKGQGKAKTRVI